MKAVLHTGVPGRTLASTRPFAIAMALSAGAVTYATTHGGVSAAYPNPEGAWAIVKGRTARMLLTAKKHETSWHVGTNSRMCLSKTIVVRRNRIYQNQEKYFTIFS